MGEKKRAQPLIIPYSDLPEVEKDKNRCTIRNYPKYARLEKFRIVRDHSAGSEALACKLKHAARAGADSTTLGRALASPNCQAWSNMEQ